MDLHVLGPLEVCADGRPVEIRPGLPRKLLATLVLRLGERVSADTLVEVLWADDPPANSRNALQILVSYLRKSLSGAGEEGAIETVLGGYRLVVGPDRVDAHRLEEAVDGDARRDDPLERLHELDGALAAWRGDPLPELADEEFAQAELNRLGELRLVALEQRVDCLLALGREADAVVDLQALVVEHPFRERFHVQLMTALYRSGRQVEALGVYERARTVLVEELGLDPGPELQAMERAVLSHSPELRTAHSGPGVPEEVGGSAGIRRSAHPAQPQPLEALIGRERDVARLGELMAERRLVTLTGPGGAGKSRLAAELAASTRRAVWWVDLSAATGREAVIASVASATGIAAQPGDDAASIATRLGGLQGLLVLDTCERVRADVRTLVESLLRGGQGLSMLTTSRQPLAAATELVWPVPPLSLPHPGSTSVEEVGASAAVQLFVQRAADRRPGFELTESNCADVARVCLLLDGLPLAIELAAAHAAALHPAAMVEVLDDRLRLLVDDTRDDRQHTLRSTIKWSHDLLADEEALFLERLAVFAGPFSLHGAEAVAAHGLPRDGLELLLALTRQSLVAVERDGRYRMLDTIRAFAWERLGERDGEATDVQRRHAAWYAALLDESAPSNGRRPVEGWRGQLQGAVLDLRQALRWCFTADDTDLGSELLASLWWLWPREGTFDEAVAWFDHSKDTVEPGTALEAAVYASSGTFHVSRGDLETAAEDSEAAARMFDRIGDQRGVARTLIPRGIALWGRGDYAAAGEAQDRGVTLFESLGSDWGRALCLVLRARTALDAQEADADARLDQAETAARHCGDQHVLAAALVLRGRLEVSSGRYVDAEKHAAESLRLNDGHGHREGALGSLHTLGLAWLGQGEARRAGGAFARALTTAVAMHHSGATAENLDGLAIVAARQQRWLDAARVLAVAEDVRARTGIRRSIPVEGLVAEAKCAVEEALDQPQLARAEGEAHSVDVIDLLVEQQARLLEA